MRLGFWTVMALGVLAWAHPASAHIDMDYPPMRGGDQKTGPCEGAARGEPTVLSPGETITVKWYETIDHPSHYRISFDEDGEDDFEDPAGFDDFYTNAAVLADEIGDVGTTHSYEITLPEVQCESCTLQIIQVMYDKGDFDGNDIYYRCADIALRGSSATDAGMDSEPMPDDGGGCQVVAGTTSAPSVLLMVAVAVFALRRRADYSSSN